MTRAIFAFVAVSLVSVSATAADYGTKEDARAMLNRAVAAVKQDKAKALEMFNKGEGGFKDRDLYVFCANASDGIITAHPTLNGGQLKDFPRGDEVVRGASEGMVGEITYSWPRPGTIKPIEKHTFYTKIGDQICGVGYYEEQ
jgi:hypothetical protein